MKVLTPTSADAPVINHDEIHDIVEFALGQSASVAREYAAAVSREPNLRGIRRRASLSDMYVNRLTVLACPEENGKPLEKKQPRDNS